MVIVGAKDIGVVGTGYDVWRLRQGLTIEPFFEDGFHAFVRTRPKGERPPTSRFEARRAVAFAQPHDP